jgi:hypothetical protein
MMQKGQKGPKVVELQRALLRKGYGLPRYGADGWLGDETLQAAFEYALDNGYGGETFEADIPAEVTDVLITFVERVEDVPIGMVDVRKEASALRKAAGLAPRRKRRWSDITGITLHQTATVLGERPRLKLGIHYVITRSGTIHYINDHACKVPQAQHLFNRHDVGIELDGYYSGIGSDLRYFWKPKSKPDRRPMAPTEELIQSARDTIRFICNDIADHGGKIEFIHAHRQTSRSRTSDPGELLWKAVGIWAQQTLGLSDGGVGYSILTGNPIPEQWDPRCKGIPYR